MTTIDRPRLLRQLVAAKHTDFVKIITGIRRCGKSFLLYIQSAWMIPDGEKMAQETFSLKHTGDNFKKIVIDGQQSARYRDTDGIGHIGLAEFLLDPESVVTL